MGAAGFGLWPLVGDLQVSSPILSTCQVEFAAQQNGIPPEKSTLADGSKDEHLRFAPAGYFFCHTAVLCMLQQQTHPMRQRALSQTSASHAMSSNCEGPSEASSPRVQPVRLIVCSTLSTKQHDRQHSLSPLPKGGDCSG